jgi:hypothetical protein
MIQVIAIVLLALTYLTISILSTRLILTSKLLGQRQKIIQIIITWLIPLIGGLILIIFNKKDKPIGSDIDKEPSWKRLVNYDEHGEV